MRKLNLMVLILLLLLVVVLLRMYNRSIQWRQEIEERLYYAKLWITIGSNLIIFEGQTIGNISFRQGVQCLYTIPSKDVNFVGVSRCDTKFHTQFWSVEPHGRIRVGSICLAAPHALSGSPVVGQKCKSNSTAQIWTLRSGKIYLRDSPKPLCLDSTYADSEKGVVIDDCHTFSITQYWQSLQPYPTLNTVIK